MLRIVDLTKRYPHGRPGAGGRLVLGVAAGEVVGLIGPSGAGKSTLIRCVNRLVEPTSGQVFLGDLEITAPVARRGCARRAGASA